MGGILIRNGYAHYQAGPRRNVRRYATLDGGHAIYDNGLIKAETPEINVEKSSPTYAEGEWIEQLTKRYTRLIASIKAGCFEVAPHSVELSPSLLRIRLLVVRRLDGAKPAWV